MSGRFFAFLFCMENREQVVADYLKLRVLLNKSNYQKDQKTEVEFLVAHLSDGKLSLRVTLTGVLKAGVLELCHRARFGHWKAALNSDLDHLEEFCADFLNSKDDKSRKQADLAQTLFELAEDLKSLGIPREDFV